MACATVQGHDLIFVAMAPSFGLVLPDGKQSTLVMVQYAAENAGLRGTVVLVWNRIPSEPTIIFWCEDESLYPVIKAQIDFGLKLERFLDW